MPASEAASVTGSTRSPSRTTTIRDVARLAAVSVGTVSRVLNRHPTVRSDTRQRVAAAIASLQFEPSQIARSLSLKRTLSVAVIVPFITTPSAVERLRGAMAGIEGTEYDLVIYNVETVRNRQHYFRSLPRRERVDGVLVFSLAPTPEEAAAIVGAGVPIVLVDAPSRDLSCVVVDDQTGGEMATRHLLELGHRRLAFIGDEYPNRFGFTSSYFRQQGFERALRAFGLEPDPDLIATGVLATGPQGREEARELTLRLLQRPDRPTAIFAASDTQAMGVLAAAEERGLEVPRDLSVVGYDDIEIASYLGLTTVHQPLFESGREAAQLLLDILATGDSRGLPPQKRTLPLRLTLRRTTAPPESVPAD